MLGEEGREIVHRSQNHSSLLDIKKHRMFSWPFRNTDYLSSDFRFASVFDRIVLRELQANTIHTMSLIGRSRIAFPFEDMAQMPTTVAADDLCPLHTESAISMPCDGTRDRVEVCRPAAAGLEFVVCLVQRCVAASAGIHTRLGLVLVVLSSAGSFGAFLAEDSELFCEDALTEGRCVTGLQQTLI